MGVIATLRERLRGRLGAPAPASDVRALYEQWAPSYPPVAHNPLMRAEEAAMRALLPEVRGARALDLACGSGRYARLLAACGAASVVALDFAAAMLAQVAAGMRVRADMSQLPLAAGAFDLIVSGLAVGHTDDLAGWHCECARVLASGGTLLYSDFHPFGKEAGWTRSFRAADGRTLSVPFHAHAVAAHEAAARRAGLSVVALRELHVGIELSESFDGSDDFYRRWRGKPIILLVRARKS